MKFNKRGQEAFVLPVSVFAFGFCILMLFLFFMFLTTPALGPYGTADNPFFAVFSTRNIGAVIFIAFLFAAVSQLARRG